MARKSYKDKSLEELRTDIEDALARTIMMRSGTVPSNKGKLRGPNQMMFTIISEISERTGRTFGDLSGLCKDKLRYEDLDRVVGAASAVLDWYAGLPCSSPAGAETADTDRPACRNADIERLIEVNEDPYYASIEPTDAERLVNAEGALKHRDAVIEKLWERNGELSSKVRTLEEANFDLKQYSLEYQAEIHYLEGRIHDLKEEAEKQAQADDQAVHTDYVPKRIHLSMRAELRDGLRKEKEHAAYIEGVMKLAVAVSMYMASHSSDPRAFDTAIGLLSEAYIDFPEKGRARYFLRLATDLILSTRTDEYIAPEKLKKLAYIYMDEVVEVENGE